VFASPSSGFGVDSPGISVDRGEARVYDGASGSDIGHNLTPTSVLSRRAMGVRNAAEMATGISRFPPALVRRALRQEVQFGCPVQGCGSPYLTWHHFDPPWAELEHHSVECMVALCLDHHKKADAGAFTRDQIRQMKKAPYLGGIARFPDGRFDWNREALLVVAGGNYYLGSSSILEVDDQKVVWLSKNDQGHDQLNLDIRRADG